MESMSSAIKYSAESPKISVMGSFFEQAIGLPEAIASNKLLGRFSHVDANTKISHFYILDVNFRKE